MAGEHPALSGQNKCPRCTGLSSGLGAPAGARTPQWPPAFPEKVPGDSALAKSVLVDPERILPAFRAFRTGYMRRKHKTIALMTTPDLPFTERKACTMLRLTDMSLYVYIKRQRNLGLGFRISLWVRAVLDHTTSYPEDKQLCQMAVSLTVTAEKGSRPHTDGGHDLRPKPHHLPCRAK